MHTSSRNAWGLATLAVGIGYCLIGRLFAIPGSHAKAWRLAAWLVSGLLFAAHIAFEHFRLRHPPRTMAFHTAVAVAIGALGLAIAGMIHSLSTTPGLRPTWILALIGFPAVTAIPAFFAALVAGSLLSRVAGRFATGRH